MSPSRAVTALAAGALASALALTACSQDGADASPSVVVSFYPLQFVVENLVGDAATVTNLTAPGVEPHDLELTPQSVGDVADADLVVYLSGFQPAVDDAVDGQATASLDVADAADLSLTTAGGTLDPHFWLDPNRLATVADATATSLVDQGILDADTATANLNALTDDLDRLDKEFSNGLADCTSRDLVTSHEAFGYLADTYDLTQVGITGLTPEAEPDPQDLAAVTAFVKENDVRTIYYETLVSPDVAETVARETGADVAVLDPLEGLAADAAGDDYLTVMATNLTTLRTGQDCR
jgi:zinc transport system substrate-binding protein